MLGADDGAWVAAGCSASPRPGTFEHGDVDPAAAARRRRPDAAPADVERWRGARERLRAGRAQRPQPARDDKVVAAWNGLAIAALAETGALLDRPDLVDGGRARRRPCCSTSTWSTGRLRRVSRTARRARRPASLEDYGDVVEGLLALLRGDRRAAVVRRGRPALVDAGAANGSGTAGPASATPRWTTRTRCWRTPAGDVRPTRRQRLPLRRRGGRRCVAVVGRADRRRRGPRASAERALALERACRGGVAAVRRLGAGRGRGGAGRAARGRGGRRPQDDPATASAARGRPCAGTAPGLVLAVGEPAGPTRRCRCSSSATCVDGGPAAYPCRGMVLRPADDRPGRRCARSSARRRSRPRAAQLGCEYTANETAT